MMLRSPDPTDPESILLFGGSGAGKTYVWLSIAAMVKKTKSPAQFWVIDNDRGARRALRGSFSELTDMVHVFNPSRFDDYDDITDEILDSANTGDFIVCDMSSSVWDGMPDWWIQNVYGERGGGYWASVRKEIVEAQKEGQKGHEKQFGGTSGVDWQFISKSYLGWEKRITLGQSDMNVIFLAAEEEIQSRYDKSGERAAAFATTQGFAPRGQKQTTHRMSTVLRIKKRVVKREVTRELVVHKDRDREHLWDENANRGISIDLRPGITGFTLGYLVKFAGWKL